MMPLTSRKISNWFTGWKPVVFLVRASKRIILPGFDGLPLYDVTVFFFRGLSKGYITSRASAISFSCFMAIFPFLIFLFTIIPFIPIQNFQQVLLDLIRNFMPQTGYETVRETMVDIITRQRSGLLFLNLILTLYFSTNGINSLIEAFNNTTHDIETRTTVKQYLISIVLVLILSFLLILAIGLMTFGSMLLALILPDVLLQGSFYLVSLEALRWLIILVLLLMAISFLYYLAPAKRANFRFISAGSLLATLLVILTTLGFNYYVDNFSKYNVLYGSIGTLLIVLVWIYMNAISLLIGFELNASILNAGVDGQAISAPAYKRTTRGSH
ncbi:MAG: YihY/virulence factor BrkB family protein [bacterium]